jgi:hypothetical protein
MDASEVRRIVEANVERLCDQLRLWDWHLSIAYRRLDGDAVAQCDVSAPYLRATITLDNDKMDTEDEVLRALRHELIHVFCWPMHAFGQHAHDMTDGESSDSAWTFYLERLVWSVEQLMDTHVPTSGEIHAETEAAV